MRKLLDGPHRLINGRRGTFQLLFAFVYLILGASFLLAAPSPTRQAALGWLGVLVPHLGYIWIIAALAALTAVHKARGDDSYSYAALTFAPLIFGGLFLIGMFLGAPLTGAISVATYWLIGAAVMVVSGMSGENDRCARNPPDGQ
jgi:FtsH-binding integral membrane protein